MQGNDSFRLIVRRGPQPNQVYELNKDIITVGRDITNDIVINDPEVSRHHMRFTRGAGGYTLEDLGSTNGTFINGQRLTGAKPLSNGDMIGLGETVTLGYEVSNPSRMEAPGATVAPASPYARQAPAAPAAGGSPFTVPPENPQPAPPPYSYSSQPSAAPSYAAEAPPQAPPGYDYDPYAVREDETRPNTMRWVLIGCIGLGLFCCCATVVGVVIVDQACLWDQIPILSSILNAVGYFAAC
jgi:pSer/pThr/pTyr-binding forkhead associated (FHA) protein